MRLPDTVAVVTGGGSGIGRAICGLFAREGASVLAADRYPDRAEETAARIKSAGGEAIGAHVDVADAGAVAAMAERAVGEYGRVDVLVNNAGLSVGDDILTIDEATWDLNLNVVLKGVFLCSKAVLPGMLERRRGVILNIASVNGLWAVGEEAYSAAKAGMINLTQNMAVKYGDRNVRVNCIAPGSIRTPIWGARVAEDPRVFDKIAKWYPLGRVGEPEDVANAALFLVSEEAAWITGVTLPVDGGLLAGSFRMAHDLQGEG
ncbi:MAG TPA: glucose 1-dehydrogenase [Thermomicrobiales bacterium]|nr:glucose 1-dehydrogenase [Thermomicrobiales bacterium]